MDQLYTQNGGEGLNAGTCEDLTAYFVTRAQQPARAVGLAGVRPAAEPRLPRVLHRARRGATRSAACARSRRRSASTTRPSTRCSGRPHPTSGRWWAGPRTSRAITKAQADEYFADLLRAQQPDRRAGGRLQDRRGAARSSSATSAACPRGKADPPEVVTLEPKQLGEKRYNAEAETSPTVRIWWHAVPFVHKDRTALDLLSDVLSGRTGRLYKGLVQGRAGGQRGRRPRSTSRSTRASSQVEAVVKDGKDPAAVEAAIYEEIERLQNEPVPAEELQKVKNQAKANAYRRLSSPVLHPAPAPVLRRAGRLEVHQHLRRRGGRA